MLTIFFYFDKFRELNTWTRITFTVVFSVSDADKRKTYSFKHPRFTVPDRYLSSHYRNNVIIKYIRTYVRVSNGFPKGMTEIILNAKH